MIAEYHKYTPRAPRLRVPFLKWFVMPIVLGVTPAVVVHAQASITGRVLIDSMRTPLANAEVRAVRPGVVAITDSAGRFALRNLPAGPVAIVTRALGFRPDTSILDLVPDEYLSREIVLFRTVGVLREVVIHDSATLVPAKLAAYEDRKRRSPGGKFLDRVQIEKWENRRTGDLFSMLAGVDVVRQRSAAYAAGSRAPPSLSRGLSSRPQPCFMDVYVDGALMYSAALQTALFDLNTIGPDQIEAIEVYTSAANTPAEFNRTSKGCGVIAIWTR